MNDPVTSGDAAGPARLDELRDACAALSHDYLARGDLRLALHAMWSADVLVLQELLLESGLDQAPDPAAQLAAVGEAVNASLSALSPEAGTPGELLARAREAMVATFDASVHAMVMSRFLPLDHLDAVPELGVGTAAGAVERRLGGRTREQLVADLEATAHDCAAVARALVLSGDPGGALRQVHHADLAAFEAFLLSTAMESGDDDLASVDLGWDLAARAFDARPVELVDGADIGPTVRSWRERLVVIGGWAHAERLRASFLPVPTA